MKNTFSESSHLTSADFLCFVLFLIISLPLLYIPPEHYRKPFLLTAASSTITAFSLFFWSLARAHGGGPLISGTAAEVVGVVQAKGSILAWAVFHGISSQMGGICAGVSASVDLDLTTADVRSPDPEHVRLHPIRRQARRPGHLPSRRRPRDGHSHLPHRRHLHFCRRGVLPKRRTSLATVRASHRDPDEWWEWC